MPLMGVWAILGLFEFLKKIPTDRGGITLIAFLQRKSFHLIKKYAKICQLTCIKPTNQSHLHLNLHIPLQFII